MSLQFVKFASVLAAGFLVAGSALAAQQVASNAPAPAAPVVHPLGGYLQQPTPSKHLVDKVWIDAKGFALYVLNRECNGQCAVTFPPLTPMPGATPPSKDWTIRTREENGYQQWVYKGKPVYTYWEDKPAEPPKADNIVPGVSLARP